jgi:hypothetical protein
MSKQTEAPATLWRTPLHNLSVPQILDRIRAICAAGAVCPQVQASRAAKQALGRLSQARENANAAQAKKAGLVAELAAASSAFKVDYSVAGTALRAYERMAGNVSGGDPAVLSEAGLGSDDLPETVPIPRKVTGVRSRPGEHAREARVAWDQARGAEGYAIQIHVGALDDPRSKWVDLPAGNRRAYRLVTASTPGARFHVRVAAIGRDRVTMEWSDPVLVIAC